MTLFASTNRLLLNQSLVLLCGILLGIGGCAVNTTGSSGAAPGGKADGAQCRGASEDRNGTCRFEDGRFAPAVCCEAPPPTEEPGAGSTQDLDCSVVWVNNDINDELFADGFASSYDLEADADSVEVSVDYEGSTAVHMSLGQRSFDADGSEFSFADETEAGFSGGLEGRTVTTLDTGDEIFELRLFAHSQIASLLVDSGDGLRQYATLDCRDNRVIASELQDVSDVSPANENHGCLAVDVSSEINGSLFEEGFGSIYDIDLQYGESMTDGDSRDVYFRFEGGEIEYVSMGQYSFEASEGDTVTVVDEREEGSRGWEGIVRTQIDWAATGESFEIKEYANGAGSVLYREAGGDEFQWFATLDCRPEMTAPNDL